MKENRNNSIETQQLLEAAEHLELNNQLTQQQISKLTAQNSHLTQKNHDLEQQNANLKAELAAIK